MRELESHGLPRVCFSGSIDRALDFDQLATRSALSGWLLQFRPQSGIFCALFYPLLSPSSIKCPIEVAFGSIATCIFVGTRVVAMVGSAPSARFSSFSHLDLALRGGFFHYFTRQTPLFRISHPGGGVSRGGFLTLDHGGPYQSAVVAGVRLHLATSRGTPGWHSSISMG